MTIGAVYASDLSRVRITCSAAPALADYATIERSVDQIRWVTVRGGGQVALVGAACQLDDYEFTPGQTNYYRATYVDTANPGLVALGTVATANNASVTPGLPGSLQDNDILVLKAAIRNTAGSVNTPAGWSLLADGGNFRVFTRTYTAGLTAPTVTFTGGVANADTAARICSVRNADFSVSSTIQANASAQDIDAPAIASAGLKPNLLLRVGWKQATSTASAMTGWVALSRDVASAGDDMTVLWWSKVTSDNEPAGVFTMTGGAAALSKAATLRFTRKDFVSQETTTILPTITDVWLKNLARPFLNRTIVVTGFSDVTQPSRSGSFPIVARSLPVAVTELRGGDNYTLTVKTETGDELEDLKAVLAAGDVVLIHLPPTEKRFPGGYFLVGAVSRRRSQKTQGIRRYFDLELEEVTAPSSVLVGATITYQGVINAFATYTDLIAANATYADVLNRIGTPADVVVP